MVADMVRKHIGISSHFLLTFFEAGGGYGGAGMF